MSLFVVPSKKKRRLPKTEQLPCKVVCLDEGVKKKKKKKEEETATKGTSNDAMDVSFGCLSKEDGVSRVEKRDDMLVTSLMAINLYLVPKNVVSVVLYWLSQYVNYKKPESHWFNDHIAKLIQYPVSFSINTTHGVPRLHAKVARHTLLLQFAGHELHKIPGEYFDERGNADLFEALDYYVNRVARHFLVRNTHGLKGEIELDGFVYNRILAYFYEPSFLIITSYQIYLHYLFHLSGGRTFNDFLPSLTLIAKPLEERWLDESLVLSLDKENSNYATKRATFLADMRTIREILTLNEVKHIEDQIELIWSRKASEVTELAYTRYAEIYSQLDSFVTQ